MNKQNELTLKHITNRARQYANKISEILDGYNVQMEKTKNEAKIRKDESEFIAANRKKHSEAARRLLSKEQETFASEVRHDAETLKDQLEQTLFRPLSAAFIQQITTMRTFGIAPSKMQLEILLSMNGGNLLGLKVLNALLKETNSKFTVQFYDVTDLEHDLEVIEHLAENADHFIPTDRHAIGCDVYRGTDKLIKRPDGQEVHTGFEWDSVALLLRNTSVNSDVKEIENMVQRWSADISTPIMDAASNAVKKEEAEQARVEGKTAPDDPDPKSTVTIENTEDDAIALAKKIGREKAGNDAMFQQMKERYGR